MNTHKEKWGKMNSKRTRKETAIGYARLNPRIGLNDIVKVKLSLCLNKHHAMKAYWESEGIAPRIL